MKKLLLIASLIALTSSAVFAEVTTCPIERSNATVEAKNVEKVKHKKDCLAKKLNLTQEQRVKAKEIRIASREKMRPLITNLREKQAIKREMLATEKLSSEQTKKVESLNSEIKDLKRKIMAIRIENMKQFEAILTEKQLKEFNMIKAESRKNFKGKHRKMGHGKGSKKRHNRCLNGCN